MRGNKFIFSWLMVMIAAVTGLGAKEAYRHFKSAVYARVYEVQKMADPVWLEKSYEVMNRTVHLDKIYLETHRDMVVIDEEALVRIIRFFQDRGIETSGGITITVNERNRFETYCYTNPEHRKKLKDVVEFTARHFNEVMLDDFFFTSCKCPGCIAAKGKASWTDFRLKLLTDAARDLILKPAGSVNPDVSVIIKYPNWYEHFQGLGFNLETGPVLFDKIYTGTETRDPENSNQHLQNYQSYLIFRYFENIKPGGNGGGWVDTGGARFLDRYAEQLWLTLFAKAPEITLFDYRQMMIPIRRESRAPWQDGGTSFDFDAMVAPAASEDGNWSGDAVISLAAGYSLEKADAVLGFLGNPVGVQSYKPFHSTGEDFLHNYLGMIGIPMDLAPVFPEHADMVFLAETAKKDPQIVDKIKKQLMAGKSVMITSGLLRALQDKGIRDIVELEYTDRKALIKTFTIGWGRRAEAEEEIMIPQIQYLTNDSWEDISSLDSGIGWPILHSADYGGGKLWVLTVPENFGDITNWPKEVAARIRQVLCGAMFVRVDGPNQVAVFVYDNNTFIVESFLPGPAEVDIVLDPELTHCTDLLTGQTLDGELMKSQTFWGTKIGEDKMKFRAGIPAHSFRVFKAE
ncbi:hypothetical protein JW948_14355 [bacterium]|nr:hypothetical protein [bacterium]